MDNMIAGACIAVMMVVVGPMAAYAKTFPVTWTLGTDYSEWATKDISVGDQLVFTYGRTHDVFVVSESDYTNCGTSSPIFSDASSPTTYPLTKEGPVYFICSTLGHCPPMKLMVNVKAAASPATPTPTTPTTPSTDAPATPADGALSPPPPSKDTPNNTGAAAAASPAFTALFFGTLFAFFC